MYMFAFVLLSLASSRSAIPIEQGFGMTITTTTADSLLQANLKFEMWQQIMSRLFMILQNPGSTLIQSTMQVNALVEIRWFWGYAFLELREASKQFFIHGKRESLIGQTSWRCLPKPARPANP